MKLPTSYIPDDYRSAVRFFIVGTIGMFVQDGIYRLFLSWFQDIWPESIAIIYIAFAIGFVVEMVLNYLFSAWYTFGTKPDIKNAGGFLLARAINLGIQYVFLHLLMHFGVAENNAGFPSIFLAGIINYFIMRLFFKTKK